MIQISEEKNFSEFEFVWTKKTNFHHSYLIISIDRVVVYLTCLGVFLCVLFCFKRIGNLKI